MPTPPQPAFNATAGRRHVVYLGLGSNKGDRRKYLDEALRLLGQQAGEVVRVSQYVETEPWGYTSANTYLNAAICLVTTLTPEELLCKTQAIERMLGRNRKTQNQQYADRTIDIDILLYDDLHLSTPQLTIPHPHMLQRDFVLKPLSEVMPQEQFSALTKQSVNMDFPLL